MTTDRTNQTYSPRQTLSDENIEQMKHNLIYGVGYKKPPIETQFKKGQSGNPKGRPRKKDATKLAEQTMLDELILQEAAKLITIREGEQTSQITLTQAILKSISKKALEGHVHAQKYMLDAISQSNERKRADINQENEKWQTYKNHWHQKIEQAKASNIEIDVPLPHPDDIVITRNQEPIFNGPLCEKELEMIFETCDLRDVLAIQWVYESQIKLQPAIDPKFNDFSTAHVLLHMINENLPERFQLTEFQLDGYFLVLGSMPKRALLKRLRQAWHSIGIKVKRGFYFPPVDLFFDELRALMRVTRDIHDGAYHYSDVHKNNPNTNIQFLMSCHDQLDPWREALKKKA